MPNPPSRLAALGVATALLLTILPLAGLVGAAGPLVPQPAEATLPPGTWTETIPEQTPRPAPSSEPWWQTTSRDLNRNGIVDWLEAREEPYPVGVSYAHEPTAEDKAALEALGKPVRVTLSDALLIGLTEPTLYPALAALPGVVMVEPYGKVVFYGDVQTPAIRARNSTEYPMGAWDLGVTGEGVNIAIVDTGIDDEHPGLAGKFVAGYDAVCYMHTDIPECVIAGAGDREDDGSFNPDDGNQHGTAVSGMATSTGANPSNPAEEGVYMGAAPAARLVDVRIGTDIGAGPFENYFLEQDNYESAMNGLQWVIDHRDDAWPNVPEQNSGIDIISLSWGITSHENGGSDGSDMHSRILDAATEAGVVVSVAAGNDGPDNDGLSGMGASSLSVTVGALDDHNSVDRTDDTVAGYSSRGPRRDNGDGYPYDELKPDVSAPGTNIVQAQGCYTSGGCNNNVPGQDASDNGYSNRGSGTSYATPAVAGVMALLLETNGNLTPALVKEILRTTAERRGPATYPELDPFWNKDFGWGMVDALIAVEEAMLLKDPENVDVELQVHVSEVQTNGSVAVSGLAWARRGVVERVEYSLDDGPWREVLYQVPEELPLPTGEYLNWTIPLSPTELRYSGDHTLFVRAVGSNGNHSLTPHAHFHAEGELPEEDKDHTALLLGLVALAVVLVAGVAAMNRFDKQEEQVLEAQKVKD